MRFRRAAGGDGLVFRLRVRSHAPSTPDARGLARQVRIERFLDAICDKLLVSISAFPDGGGPWPPYG